MTQTYWSVAVFLLLLGVLALALHWLKRRGLGAQAGPGSAARIISVLALGPQQKLITVEVGTEGVRSCLVLGVTSQSISCLHSQALGSAADASHLASAPLLSSVAGPSGSRH